MLGGRPPVQDWSMHRPENNPVRDLPPVNELLADPRLTALTLARGREAVLDWVRQAIGTVRKQLLAGEAGQSRTRLAERAVQLVEARGDDDAGSRLGSVINATGVILHTGLGRAPLSEAAVRAMEEAA